ncbi:ABC transporter ATP-binding protein [Modestobacter italicus]|uniref:ABC transporter ATP-binding protein n=1 Tax=Modestobacter italicus (strain DSM 44449 / CECT 9708 / BC 501) TaxID=2732864 RepID=UPI001C98A99E|nr:ABC transporter ATP-binding protein [Modestobacter italicus]
MTTSPTPAVRGFLALMRPVRVRVAVIAVLTAVGVALTAVGPLVLARATDLIVEGLLGSRLPADATRAEVVEQLRASGQDALAGVVSGTGLVPGQGIDFDGLARLLMLAVLVYCAASGVQLLAARQMNVALHLVMRDLRDRAERKINLTPVATADARGRGDLLSRVTNDIDNVTVSMTQCLGQLLTAVLTVAGVLGAMLYLSPVLTAATLATLPLALLATRLLMRRSQGRFIAQWQQLGELTTTVEDSITGHEVSTAFHRGDAHVADFVRRNDRLAEESFRAQALSGLAVPVMAFLGNLSYVVICVVGGLRVATGTMTIGDVQAFVQYSRQFSQPISAISGLLNELQSGVASAQRVLEFLDGPEEDAGVPTDRPTVGRIEFQDVEFGYDPARPVLRGLTFRAEPGETVAIVGPTGAGKTTLVNLLLRFHEPDRGRIVLDGQDIAGLDRADLRSRFGLVLQDTWLFAGSIADNIAYGRHGADRADVERAARLAGVEQFADALPDGLDTLLEVDGQNLSAGERQLITIARAFVAEPSVLVLDEATSSVDSRTSMLVQQALATLRHDRTCLVIAHRLSTIRHADRIVVLDAGRVVEVGSHEDLVSSGGTYARLQDAQLLPA